MKNPKELLARNVFSNWATMFVAIIFTFLVTPYIVHKLGKDIYGIWALIFSIVAYSNFLDMGMKQSLARFIPKYYALRDYKKLNEIINSSFLIYAVTGLLVAAGTLIFSYFFLGAFNIDPALLPMTRIALIIIGLNQSLYFFFMAITALGTFHRYDLLNGTEIAKTVIGGGLTIYFLSIGHGIITLAILTISLNLVTLIARRIIQQRIVPQIRLGRSFINRESIRDLLGYGAISFFILICWIVIFNTDNIIIGIFLTTTSVAYYNIAISLINYLRALLSSIGVPFVPTVSHLHSTENADEISRLHFKVSGYLFYFVACVSVITYFFVDKFISLWVGPDFQDTVYVLYILIFSAPLYLPQTISNSVLLGIGRHKPLLYILIAEAAGNIVLSLVLVRIWGILGVALGTAIPQLIIYSSIYPYIYFKIVPGRVSSFLLNGLKNIALAVVFVAPVSALIAWQVAMNSWLSFFAFLPISILAGAFGFWWKILSPEDKKKVASKIRGFFGKNNSGISGNDKDANSASETAE